MSPEERAQARADELEMLLIREAVGLVVMCGIVLLLSPSVKLWCQQQAWRLRKYHGRARDREESMVAELRRDLSRIEHGDL